MSPHPERLGKYEIRREVGRGSMGVVYEAFDPVIQRRVAIKVIRQDDFGTVQGADLIARLKREAQAAGRLSHPGIVAIHDFGEGDRTAYIAMEFVEGRELRALLDDGRRFAPEEAVRILLAVLAALQHAHERGVTHRDIKPANVILLPDGGVKIADFGVARIEASELTQAGTIIGTPMYMSPEQILGLPVDGRSDLFSCGVLLYELLTGSKPFNGSVATVIRQVLEVDPQPPSQLDATLGSRWDPPIRRALAKKPEQRYASAREMAAALDAALHAGLSDDPDATVVLAQAPRAPLAAAAAATLPPAAAAPVAASAASAPRPTAPAPAGSTPATASRGPRLAAIAAGVVALAAAGVVGWRQLAAPPPPMPTAAAPAPTPPPVALSAEAPATPSASPAPVAPPSPAPAPTAAPAPPPAAAAPPAPSPAPSPSPPSPPPARPPAPPAAAPATPPAAAATKPLPAPPTPPPVTATPSRAADDWAARLDVQRFDAAPQPTTLSAAVRRVLDPFDAADAARLEQFDALLAQQPRPFALAIGVKDGRLALGVAGGADAAAAAGTARRRCAERGAQGCITVWADGTLRRRAFHGVVRELGEQSPRAVRAGWLQAVGEAVAELRAASAAQAAAKAAPPAPRATAPTAPPAAAAPASAPPAPVTAAAPAPPPPSDWARARARLRDARDLAGGLAALLGVESAAERQLLERFETEVRRWRWKSALAMGENAQGYIVWGWAQEQQRTEWAEERAIAACAGQARGGCLVVAADGAYRAAALSNLAARLGSRPQGEVREAFLRNLERRYR